jgi:hypothetical protein
MLVHNQHRGFKYLEGDLIMGKESCLSNPDRRLRDILGKNGIDNFQLLGAGQSWLIVTHVEVSENIKSELIECASAANVNVDFAIFPGKNINL